MSIQWMDNFQAYGIGGQALMLNGLYATKGGTIADDPDSNAPAASVASKNDIGMLEWQRKVLTSGQTTVGVGLRIWMPILPGESANTIRPIDYTNGANLSLTYLLVTTTGALQVYNGAGTFLGASVGPVLIANAWQHVEMATLFHASAGTVEVRVEGVTVINLVGKDTLGGNTGPCEQVRQYNASGASILWFMKDYIIWDDSGDHNNDFLGSVSIFRLVPNADVTLGGWTTSSGATGFSLIDESPPVDGGYVQADSVPPVACEFDLTNLPADVVSVRGLMTLVRAAKTDGGDATLQVSVGSDGDYANGADRPITTAFTFWYDIQEEDPSTVAPWLPSAVNLATLVLDRTT